MTLLCSLSALLATGLLLLVLTAARNLSLLMFGVFLSFFFLIAVHSTIFLWLHVVTLPPSTVVDPVKFFAESYVALNAIMKKQHIDFIVL